MLSILFSCRNTKVSGNAPQRQLQMCVCVFLCVCPPYRIPEGQSVKPVSAGRVRVLEEQLNRAKQEIRSYQRVFGDGKLHNKRDNNMSTSTL